MRRFNPEILEDRVGYTKKVALLLFSHVVVFGLAWLGFYVASFSSGWFLSLNISSLVVASVVSVSVIIFRKRLTKAVQYYLLIIVLLFTPLLTIFSASFLLARNVYGGVTWQLAVVAILVAFQLGLLQYKSDCERLTASLSHNIKSGRYTPQNGLWKVRKTLHWDNPKDEKETFIRYERLARLSYLIPGIGYLFARNSSVDEKSLFSALICYTFVLITVSGIARHAAIIFHLLFLENKYSKPVTIVDS